MIALILTIVIVLVLLAAGAGFFLFTVVLDQKYCKNRNGERDAVVPADDPKDNMYPTYSRLYNFQTPYIEQMGKMDFEDLEITSFDGLKLCGHLIRGNEKEVVILVHGYRSCKENCFADKIGIYLDRGSTVLLVEDRSHGSSEGRYIGFSQLDQFDVAKWVDKVNELFDEPKIYLHGVSMGGATVVHCADKKLKNVCGIVDDCGFDSIDHLVRSIIRTNYHIPYFPIGALAAFFAKTMAGIDFSATDGIKCVENTDVPMVFIHGDEDHFVPAFMSRQLYDACRSPKELLMVPGAGHAAAYMMAQAEYTELVNKLLDGEVK